jgi:hypothetical protein
MKLKAWVNNPHTLDVKVGVSGTLGHGQVEFGVHWDLSISGVGKEIKGQVLQFSLVLT